MNDEQLRVYLGSAVYETHGSYFKELIKAGCEVEGFYDGGRGWGDVSKILALVAVLRGAKSYMDYVEFYNMVKQDHDGGMLTPRAFARLTGVKSKPHTQTDRTRNYRQRQAQELKQLRELTALAWIDDNLDKARSYIATKTTETK